MENDDVSAKVSPAVNRGGQPPAMKPKHTKLLLDIMTERAQASLEELADELHRRSGLHVCVATIWRHLPANGIVRLKARRRPYVAAQASKRYGYSDAHRRENVAPYNTNLTNAERQLISDLFEHDAAKRGAPPRYSQRDLVNVCCYVLRTGCSWRLLPNSFASW